MTSIIELYLHNSFFADEANKTIGEPGITSEILMNRRNVTNRLTDEGKKLLNEVIDQIKFETNEAVLAVWDIHCGCSSCPCSPGFRIKITGIKWKLREQDRFSIWIDEKKNVKVNRPAHSYKIPANIFNAIRDFGFPSEGEKAVREVIQKLNKSISRVEKYLETLFSPYDWICYWPSVFLTVCVDNTGKPFITSNDLPMVFEKHVADNICRNIRNGLNEYPVAINEKDFYTNYLIWLKQQIVNTKALLN